MTLRASEGVLILCFDLRKFHGAAYTKVISVVEKSGNVSFNTKHKCPIELFIIDATGFKVYGEGEREVKKHPASAECSVSCIFLWIRATMKLLSPNAVYQQSLCRSFA